MLMHILAVDTSRTPGSVALLEDQQLIRERELPAVGRTTQHLFPVLQGLLAEVGWQPRDVGLLAVTLGPGSFTGLRIGITLAKLWTYASSCQLVALGTLDIVAAQAESNASRLEVVLHAERGQLFQASYQRVNSDAGEAGTPARIGDPAVSGPEGGEGSDGSEGDDGDDGSDKDCKEPTWGFWRRASSTSLVNRADWLRNLVPGTAVTGDGLSKIEQPLPEGIAVEPQANWTLRAGTLGRLAFDAFHRGEQVDPWSLLPQYGRPSAAEEKRLQSQPHSAE